MVGVPAHLCEYSWGVLNNKQATVQTVFELCLNCGLWPHSFTQLHFIRLYNSCIRDKLLFI